MDTTAKNIVVVTVRKLYNIFFRMPVCEYNLAYMTINLRLEFTNLFQNSLYCKIKFKYE
jgi:hypothetical protein